MADSMSSMESCSFSRVIVEEAQSQQPTVSSGKYCVVCRSLCLENESNGHIFPGSVGCRQLNNQLLFMFFLRHIIQFPVSRCALFLKRCRGRRMPDTWFFLCQKCLGRVGEGAKVYEKILALQDDLEGIRRRLRSEMHGSIYLEQVAVKISEIEGEIRQHILAESPHVKKELNEEFILSNEFNNLREEFDDSGGDGGSMDYLVDDDQEWAPVGSGCDRQDNVIFPGRRQQRERDRNRRTQATLKSGVDFSCEDNIVAKISEELEVFSQAKQSDDFEQCGDESDNKDFASLLKSTKALRKKMFVKKPSIKGAVQSKRRGRKPRKRDTVNVTREKSEDGAESYVCEICPSKYKDRNSFKSHIDAHEISKSLDNKYDCTHCGYPCSSAKACAIHMTSKHKAKGVPCTLCSYVAPSKRQFFVHLKQHKESSQKGLFGGKFSCTLCTKLFSSYGALCRHTRTTHYQEMKVMPFKCELCSSIFASKRNLTDHIQQTHKNQSKYYCEICGKGTMYASKLRRHMKSHIQERKCEYVCEVCGADFFYVETMRSHIRKQHPEKAFENHPDLLKSFVDNTDAPVPLCEKFKCKHCGIQLGSSTCLVRHIKTHTDLFKNVCDICGNGYATPQSLKRHKMINHSPAQVPCPYCKKTFPHKDYVQMHYKYCKQYQSRQQTTYISVNVSKNSEQHSISNVQESQPSAGSKVEPSSSVCPRELKNSEEAEYRDGPTYPNFNVVDTAFPIPPDSLRWRR